MDSMFSVAKECLTMYFPISMGVSQSFLVVQALAQEVELVEPELEVELDLQQEVTPASVVCQTALQRLLVVLRLKSMNTLGKLDL